jgi:hypothetical protein
VDNAAITLAWSKSDVGQTEMLFDQTVDDMPLVEPVEFGKHIIWGTFSGKT